MAFSNLEIENNLTPQNNIPIRIQAENFIENFGFSLETCLDTGGGLNTAYANSGDYLDYLVNVNEAGTYKVEFRVASQTGNAAVTLQYEEDGVFSSLGNFVFSATGGWQTYKTFTDFVDLPAGKYIVRLKVLFGEHNLNWINFSSTVSARDSEEEKLLIYPNPARDAFNIHFTDTDGSERFVYVYNAGGRLIEQFSSRESMLHVNTTGWERGIYMVVLKSGDRMIRQKQIIY